MDLLTRRPQDDPLTRAQEDELEVRLASIEGDCGEGISWSAMKAELEQRCRSGSV